MQGCTKSMPTHAHAWTIISHPCPKPMGMGTQCRALVRRKQPYFWNVDGWRWAERPLVHREWMTDCAECKSWMSSINHPSIHAGVVDEVRVVARSGVERPDDDGRWGPWRWRWRSRRRLLCLPLGPTGVYLRGGWLAPPSSQQGRQGAASTGRTLLSSCSWSRACRIWHSFDGAVSTRWSVVLVDGSGKRHVGNIQTERLVTQFGSLPD